MTAPHVEMTDGSLVVGRQSWPLHEIRTAAAEQQDPDIRIPLAVAVVSGVGAVPAAIIAVAHGGEATVVTFAVIAVASVAFFAAVLRLLSMDTRYRVVIETPQGARSVLATTDHQLVLSLVARINDRIDRLRPRPRLVVE